MKIYTHLASALSFSPHPESWVKVYIHPHTSSDCPTLIPGLGPITSPMPSGGLRVMVRVRVRARARVRVRVRARAYG